MSLRQLIKRLRIKGRRYISAADLIPVVRCDLGLEIQDDPRLVVGVIQPGQGEHLGNVALIGLANLGLVVVTIVGLVGQAKPSLAHPRYVMRGVGRVRLVGEVEQGTQGLAVMLAQQCHELGRRRHAVDACQDRGQGAGARGRLTRWPPAATRERRRSSIQQGCRGRRPRSCRAEPGTTRCSPDRRGSLLPTATTR